MEQTARVPNPVTGRGDEDAQPRPVTPLMVVGRYSFALLIPALMLIWFALPEDAGRWPVLVVGLLMISVVSPVAHGSWWGTSWPISPGWGAAMLAELAVLTVGMVVSILTDETLVLTFAATLLVGAVLGAAARHGWAVLRSRRHPR